MKGLSPSFLCPATSHVFLSKPLLPPVDKSNIYVVTHPIKFTGKVQNHIEERRRVIFTVEAIGTVVDGQSVVNSIETKLAFFDPICYTTNYAPKVRCKPVL